MQQTQVSQDLFPVPTNSGACAGGAPGVAPGFPNGGNCQPQPVNRPGAQINVSTQAAVSLWLKWLGKAIRDFNRFGFQAATRQRTNLILLPDPIYGWEVGFNPGQTACGANFLIEWTGEAIGCEVYRIEIDWIVQVIRGTKTEAEISAGNYRALDAAIIQFGSEDRTAYVLNLGQSRNAGPSELVPAWSGYYICADGFVPFMPRVELQSLQLSGTAVGTDPADSYNFGGNVRYYWRRMAD